MRGLDITVISFLKFRFIVSLRKKIMFKSTSLFLLCNISSVILFAQSTYKVGSQGAYGTGGSYVAPPVIKNYSTPVRTSPSGYSSSNYNSKPNYYPSNSSNSTRTYTNQTSNSNKYNPPSKPFQTIEARDAEVKEWELKEKKRIELRKKAEEQWTKEYLSMPLFCNFCICKDIETEVKTFMKYYKAKQRDFLNLQYSAERDHELAALCFVSSKIPARSLLLLPKMDALYFTSELRGHLTNIARPDDDKFDRLKEVRNKIANHVAGAAPEPEKRKIFNINSKYGFEDEWGCIVISPQYDRVYDFEMGAALVCKGEKYGYIDLNGKVIVPIDYTDFVRKGDYSEMNLNGKTYKFYAGGKRF